MTKKKTQKNKKFASVRYHLHLPTYLHDADQEQHVYVTREGAGVHSMNPIGKDVF